MSAGPPDRPGLVLQERVRGDPRAGLAEGQRTSYGGDKRGPSSLGPGIPCGSPGEIVLKDALGALTNPDRSASWHDRHPPYEAVRLAWDVVRPGWPTPPWPPVTASLSGIIGHDRYLLRPRSAGRSGCPRVAVTIPDRPPDRARVGHGPQIRRHGRAVQCWLSLGPIFQACRPVPAAGHGLGSSVGSRTSRPTTRGRCGPCRRTSLGFR